MKGVHIFCLRKLPFYNVNGTLPGIISLQCRHVVGQKYLSIIVESMIADLLQMLVDWHACFISSVRVLLLLLVLSSVEQSVPRPANVS